MCAWCNFESYPSLHFEVIFLQVIISYLLYNYNSFLDIYLLIFNGKLWASLHKTPQKIKLFGVFSIYIQSPRKIHLKFTVKPCKLRIFMTYFANKFITFRANFQKIFFATQNFSFSKYAPHTSFIPILSFLFSYCKFSLCSADTTNPRRAPCSKNAIFIQLMNGKLTKSEFLIMLFHQSPSLYLLLFFKPFVVYHYKNINHGVRA